MKDNLKISIFDISVVRLLIDQGVVTVKQTEEGYEIVGRGMFLILKDSIGIFSKIFLLAFSLLP